MMVMFSPALMALMAAALPFALAVNNNNNNNTVDIPELKTWWHNEAEINTKTPVAATNVRQSHLYNVQVAPKANNNTVFYDSFVYESIPRSGKGQICQPDSTEICSEDDDGISIEADIGATMAWSQFLYNADATIKVSRRDGVAVKRENVIIRPTNLGIGFTILQVGDAITVIVPYRADTNGMRFSIEIQDDLWEYRNGGPGSSSYYVQNATADGKNYVKEYTSDMPIVGREPRNALLVFASPFPSSDMIPPTTTTTTNSDSSVYSVQPGKVSGLDSISNEIVSFGPGIYYFTGTAHAILSSTVRWVHLAPGAYVKGALQYMNGASPTLLTTGHGVLSGEEYVYQANPAASYSNTKSDATSLKMFRGENITAGQRWILNGPTMANQPFNAMDFYGVTDGHDDDDDDDDDAFTIDVTDYKQVGAWFAQTDGLAMYAGSHVRDVFYHSGDDTIKTYYSNVRAERIVVWKTHNGPLVQLGWYPREISNVTLDHIDVIHSRYSSQLPYAPRALIGSAASYEDSDATDTADTAKSISNYTITNIRGEGIQPGLLGLNLLSNINGFKIENIFIDKFAPNATGLGVSNVKGFTDKSGSKIKVEDFVIKSFIVGTAKVTFDANNWDAESLGGLYFDEDYWGSWTVEE